MPIIDVDLVVGPDGPVAAGLAQSLADAAGRLLGSPAGQTWGPPHLVALQPYAGMQTAPAPTLLPIFGLAVALAETGIAAGEVVGIGDAENDRDFLAACGCAVAVANALAELKTRCDLVTAGEAGAGVVELIDRMLAGDLPSRARPTTPIST